MIPFASEEYCLALQSSSYFAISPSINGFPQGSQKINGAYQQTLEFRQQYPTIQGRWYYITSDAGNQALTQRTFGIIGVSTSAQTSAGTAQYFIANQSG